VGKAVEVAGVELVKIPVEPEVPEEDVLRDDG
jgi:hypothetical protein